ncbi:hypothetical protein MAR_038305 [Mya arenaria]|uniref:Dynamin N-terminal domain-containing protein n=1 Tax=Mya arenaria TaxID=6604 RepID=A0ABY7FV87_MYAAR|nr:hypothetical protein MAR_038305 [Mya arenaria]
MVIYTRIAKMNSGASGDIRLEDVETMDLGAVYDFLEARQVPYSDVVDLEEMRELVRRNLQQAVREPSDADSSSDNCSTGLNGDLRDLIDELYGKNFAARLEVNQRELVDGDCPITSAGKSSLLNLLLGMDILQYSLLSSTSTICLLRNIRSTDRRRFVVYPKSGGPGECHNVEEGREKEALERLTRAVSEDRNSPGDNWSHVEIYWSIPLLGENTQVTIVDTPGVGESGEMTSRLFRYLPNAIAFIYVINSANAGGIQEDKWDIVEDREGRQPGTEKKVWEDTLDKLGKYFPNYNRDHVYKMYTTQAKKCVSLRLYLAFITPNILNCSPPCFHSLRSSLPIRIRLLARSNPNTSLSIHSRHVPTSFPYSLQIRLLILSQFVSLYSLNSSPTRSTVVSNALHICLQTGIPVNK